MRRRRIELGALGLLLLNAGCATIVNDSTVDFTIESEPSGASIEINDQPLTCKTPCTRQLKTNKDYKIAVTTADGVSDETTVTHGISGWWYGNFAIGAYGVIGMGIDYLTGGMYKLSHTGVEFDLTESEEEEEEAPQKEVKESPKPTPSPRPATPAAPTISSPGLAPNNVEEAKRLEQIKEAYPASSIDEQIRNYYGPLPPEDLAATRQRIYYELLDQERRGAKADVDDAIRMDHFR